MLTRISILVMIFLIIFNCNCILSTEKDNETHIYQYTAFDSVQKAMVQGSLTIQIRDSSKFVGGSWQFTELRKTEYGGPQIGKGQLIGEKTDNKLWMNLNPQNADNNILLEGVMDEKSITGKWTWITLSGPTSSGLFEAKEN